MEKDIFAGNRFVILGLLEDLRIFYDGLPPRKISQKKEYGPYLG